MLSCLHHWGYASALLQPGVPVRSVSVGVAALPGFAFASALPSVSYVFVSFRSVFFMSLVVSFVWFTSLSWRHFLCLACTSVPSSFVFLSGSLSLLCWPLCLRFLVGLISCGILGFVGWFCCVRAHGGLDPVGSGCRVYNFPPGCRLPGHRHFVVWCLLWCGGSVVLYL